MLGGDQMGAAWQKKDKRDMDILEWLQGKTTEMMKGLEQLT